MVEVPFRFVAGQIRVMVAVAGAPPLEFVLDTGAPSAVVIGADTLGDVELDVVGQARVQGAGSSQEAALADVARGVTFGIGDLTLHDLTLIVLPREGAAHMGNTDWSGIFGGQLFASAAVEIDYDAQRLRIFDAATYTPHPDAIALPLERRNGHVHVQAQVVVGDEVRDVWLVVDTGASHALALMPSSVPPPARRLADVKLGRGLSGQIRGDLARIDALLLGGVRLESVLTSFPDASAGKMAEGDDGNLGSEVLRRFRVTLDYSRDRMLLVPTAATRAPFEFTTTGFRFEPWIADDGTIGIDDVYPGTAADNAGLRVGERVRWLDGQPVAELGIDAARALTRGTPGTVLRLGVLRDDVVHTVELTLATVL